MFKGIELPQYEDPLQKPAFIFYPALHPKPWFERGEFAWIREYEAETPGILAEYQAVIRELGPSYTDVPYVSKAAAHDPRWRDLAGSTDWSSLHLFQSGNPQGGLLERCQKTFAALKHLPLARGRNHAPEVFFSTLKPGATLPAHHGLSNAKLTIHLGLDVPPLCGIRVGDETRTWRERRCLIFDDSFEHAAWNHDSVPRLVLIADIWNPLLDPDRTGARGPGDRTPT
ncbi:aspartyl/asparaginyl beta-hydroxylase, partial [mine drainage metagenome]